MKKFFSLIITFILAVSLTGCQEGKINNNEPSVNVQQDENPAKTDENDENKDENKEIKNLEIDKEEVKNIDVVLYFPNSKYIETGEESLGKFIAVQKNIEVKDQKIAEAIILNLYEDPKEESAETSLNEKIKLKSIKIVDGIAFVDFYGDNLDGGSLEEEMVIGQVVNSLLELKNINGVQFLVDGTKSDTLMGHYDTTEPFTEKFK